MKRLIGVGLLLVGAALAAGPDKEAAAHYSAGNRAFEDGDFPKAIDELKQSVTLKPTVKAYLVLGNAYIKLGQLDDARAAFEKVLEVDPKSSKRKVVEQHIKDLGTLAKTKLAIQTVPPGAVVYIDLKAEGARGKTPLSLGVIPGRHRVMVELEGFESASAEAVAVEGQDVPVQLSLKVKGCDINVGTLPDKAELRVDAGEPLTTPATVRVSVGEHLFELNAPGYLPKSRTVACPAEKQTFTVSETLEKPRTAMLMMRTQGKVRVDGQAVADAAKMTVPAGRHEVSVELPGKAPWSTELVLASGQELELTPKLEAPAAEAKKTELSVSSEALGARLFIDGRPQQADAAVAVTPGPHAVEVRARGYEPFRSQVSVADGESRRMSAHLERRGGAALAAGLAFTMLAVGSAALTIAAHFSADREIAGSSDFDAWHAGELAGYGLMGGFGALALTCYVIGGVQRGTGDGGEPPRVSWAPTGVRVSF